MKSQTTLALAVIFLAASSNVFAQSWTKAENVAPNYYDIRQQFLDHWEGKTPKKGTGYNVFRRWEWYWEGRIMPDGSFPPSNFTKMEWDNYLAAHPQEETENSVANWTSMGPNSSNSGYNGIGRVNCVTVHPTNSNTIWVGTPAGGLWKTTNGGTSWTTNTDNFTVLGVSAVVIDPLNTNTMYIGTGDGFSSDTRSIGVLKSTDGGTSWSPTGLAWNVTNNLFIRFMAIHPTSTGTVLVAASNGLYRTTNGGTSWTRVVNDNFYDVKFNPGDPSVVYAASDDKLYKSTDSGATWTTSMTVPDTDRLAIAVTPANTALVAAVSSSDLTDNYGGLNGVYVSTNSGTSYTLKASSPNILSGDPDGSEEEGQGWYDLCITISPTNANLIFVGGVNLWKSTNGGTTWSLATHWRGSDAPPGTPVVHADKHALTWSGNTLFKGCDGGIYKTTNNGTSWTDISSNLAISQMYRLGVSQSDNKVICGLQDNGTKLRSTTGVWTDNIGGDGMECFIHPTNSNIMYGEWQYGRIRRSTNGGAFWTNIHANVPGEPEGAWETPFVMDPNVSSTIYVGYDQVYKSTDQGNTWTSISPALGIFDLRYIAVAPTSSNTIYACDGDQVFVTTNGGTSWNNVTGNLPTSTLITYLSVDPQNANNVYVTFAGYVTGQKVYRSTTGGTTWTNISGTLPNLPANCVIVQPNSGGVLYASMDVGVFRRDPSTSNWTLFNTGLPNVPVEELEIRNSTGKIRAATYGRGLWESDLEPIIMCDVPTGLTATDITPRAATLGWADVSTADSFTVELRPVGSTAWFPFTGITSNEFSVIYFPPCTNWEFRVQAFCGSNFSTSSAIQNFSIPGCGDYCYSYGQDESPFPAPDEWIENVNIGDINNTSGNNWGYNDYTNLSTNVTQGNDYTIILTPGFPGDSFEETWSVWIDYNKDNDFADAGEQVFTHPGSSTAVAGTFTIPANAAIGNTRMRVTMKWDTLAGPCDAPFEYGEVEDYTLNIQPGAVCDVPTNLSVANITNRTANLKWNTVPAAVSYTVQLRQTGAPNWIEFADFPSNDFFVIYFAPCTNYEFRVKTVCAGGESTYSTPVAFSTTGCSNYCYSYGEDESPFPDPDEWIESVSMGSINNTSGNNWGYNDYTNLSTNVTQGNNYTINLTPGFSGTGFDETWSVWIDYNKDNDFSDAGEQVFTHPGSSTTVAGTFTVPANAAIGNTRMRVTMKWDTLAGPCDAPFEYGEVEDYTLNINAPAPVLTINPSNLSYPAAGSSQTITLTTNCNWNVSGVPSWLTVAPSSGAAGTFTLAVTAATNGSTSAQSATLIFTGCNGQVTQNLSVTQSGASAVLTLNPTNLSYPAAGNSQTITLTTNCDWNVSNVPSWLTVVPSSGTAGTFTLTATAAANGSTSAQSVTLAFSGCNGQVTQNLSVTQNGSGAVLTLNPTSLSYPAVGSSQTITLTTNCDWSVSNVPSWLTVVPSSGTAGTFTLTATAAANGSTNAQSATLAFTSCNGQASQNVAVTQSGANAALTVNPASLSYPAAGSSQTVTLTTNCDWSVSNIPSWLTVIPSSGTAGMFTLTVTATTNGSTNAQSATLTFVGCNGQTSQNIPVTQSGASAVLTANPANLSYPAAGNSQAVTLTTNCDWSVSGVPTWLTVAPSSGGAGTFTLTVTATANGSTNAQSATLTFVGCNGQTSQGVVVMQSGASAVLAVNPASLSYPAAGNSQTVTLTTNCDWSVSGAPAWLTVAPASGAAGTFTLTLTATANGSTNVQSATLAFIGCNGQVSQNVTVTQNAAAFFVANPTQFNVGSDTSCVSLSLMTNTPWTASATAPWISINPASGTGNATVEICFEENADTIIRTGEVVFTPNGLSPVVVTVTQAKTVGVDDLGNIGRNSVTCIPNPVQDNAWFVILANRRQNVNLDVLAEDGRLVVSMKSIAIVAGENVIPWQPRDLPAGTYLFRCSFEKEVVSGKIVLMR